MRYLSFFSGIEAASAAWKALGWKPAAFAEVEAFPSAVLAYRFPEVPNLGDVTKLSAERLRALGAVDLLVAGAPCQAFSVAGLRKGLADPRGNLTLELLRLLDLVRPRWLVFENVPGLLTSATHDAPDPRAPAVPVDVGSAHEVVVEDEYEADEVHAFACFLAGLSELGYGWAYRCLDARYFGLAQRRERVFVVARLGDARAPAAVLLERSSLSGDPPSSREAGEGAAGRAPHRARGGRPDAAPEVCDTITSGGGEGRGWGGTGGGGGIPVLPVAPTLTRHNLDSRSPQSAEQQAQLAAVAGALGEAGGHARPGDTPDGAAAGYLVPEDAVAKTLLSPRDGSGGGYRADEETETLIPEQSKPILGAGAGASGYRANGGEETLIPEARVYENHAQDSRVREVDIAPQINAKAGTDGNNLPLVGEPLGFDRAQITSNKNYSNPRPGDPQPPLNTAGQSMVAFVQNQREEVRDLGDLAGAVKPDGTHEQTFVAIPLQEPGSEREKAQHGIGVGGAGDPMFTLQAGRQHAIAFDGYNHSVSDQSPTLGVNAGTSTGRGGVLEEEPRVGAVCLFDAKSGIWMHGNDRWGSEWWRTGNGSCDCNRLEMMCGLDLAEGRCLGVKRAIALPSWGRLDLHSFNNGYDPALIEQAFLRSAAELGCPHCQRWTPFIERFVEWKAEKPGRDLVGFCAAQEPVVFDAHATPGQPVSPTLTGGKAGGGRNDMNLPCVVQNTGRGFYREDEAAAPIRGEGAGGGRESTLVAFSSKGAGHDAGELSPTMRAAAHDLSRPNAGAPPAVAIPIALQDALRTDGRTGVGTPGTGVGHDGDPAQTIRGGVSPAVAFSTDGRGAQVGPLAPTLQASSDRLSNQLQGVIEPGPAFGASDYRGGAYQQQQQQSNPLTGSADRSRGAPVSLHGPAMRVRRLTPVECERLQGFPDDWTRVPVAKLRHRKKCPECNRGLDGKPTVTIQIVPPGYRPPCGCPVRVAPIGKCPDGPRYRALGNSMAVPVMRWIGERIGILDAALQALQPKEPPR